MGFFSGITKSLFGGSDSSSGSTNRSGFSLLPTEIQDVYKDYATDLSGQFVGGAGDDLFNPLDMTGYEANALSMIGQGITPDASTLSSDIAMQMNPFDDYVINDINRQAQSDYSILNQALDSAGQMGSNRGILGANDIEQTRLNTIGKFKQDQYNTALDNSLNQLTQARAQDIGLNLGAGEFQRELDFAERQAPISAMQQFGQLLGVLPTSGGSEGSSSSKSSSENGIFKSIGLF